MKKLTITAAMLERLKKVNPDVDPDKISVYEATAINTLPIVKKGSIFHGAKMTESTMQEFVEFLLNGGNVPMHQIHDQSYGLPVGKVFHAEKIQAAGLPEVRILFYVDNTEDKLIAKIESSTIDEVSIGAETKHMLCSECGFDYKGEKATAENFWNQTCDEGHTIGTDGVHLSLSGLENWYETSLVSRGAARNAKIVGRAKSLLGEVEYNRLAATGIDPSAKILFATATPNPKSPENSMDTEKLVLQLTTISGENAVLKAAETRHAATVTELTGKVTAAETKVTELTATVSDLTAKLTAASATPDAKIKESAEKATKALFSMAETMAIASGNTKPAADADVDALVASIDASKVKLSALPIGGVTQNQTQGGDKGVAQYTAAAFQTRN